MAGTYEPIATYTVGSSGSVSSYTFSSIPQIYTDLILVTNMSATPGPEVWLRFNGDSATNYSFTIMAGTGSSANSSRLSNATRIDLNDGLSANAWSNAITQIYNYTNTTTYKTTIGRSNSTSDDINIIAGLWRSTAAISSITILFDRSSTWNANSTFTLYGIKAA